MLLTGAGHVSMSTSLKILNITKQASPAIVLGLFVVGFVVYSIVNAPSDGDQVPVQALRGPGGRPLPFRRKSANQVKEDNAIKDASPTAKLVFRLGQTGVIATFIVDAVIILLQVLFYRKDSWWPGQSAIVGNDRLSRDRFLTWL